MSGLKGGIGALSLPQKLLFGGIGLLVLVLLILLAVGNLAKGEREENEELVNTGVTIERGRQNEETVNAVAEGLDARHNASDAERRVVCEKYDRNCADNK